MVPRFESGAEACPGLLLLTTPAPTPAPSPAPTPRPTPRPTRLPTRPAVASTLASTHTRTVPGAFPGTDAVARPGEGRKDVLCGRSRRPGRDGRRRCRTVDSRWFICFVQKTEVQKQYAREQDEEAPFDVDSPRQTPRPPLMPPPPPPPANLVDDNDLEADFEEWDYADETMGDEAKERPLDTPSPRRNSVTSYVARRKGRLVEWRPDGSAFVKWSEGDRFCACFW